MVNLIYYVESETIPTMSSNVSQYMLYCIQERSQKFLWAGANGHKNLLIGTSRLNFYFLPYKKKNQLYNFILFLRNW
jgi:hypothetical protein